MYVRISKMDKRKRVLLPIEKKIEIIEKFHKGLTVKAITVEYNVHERVWYN